MDGEGSQGLRLPCLRRASLPARERAGEDCEIKPASFSDRLQGQHEHIATPICHRDLLRRDNKTISEIAYAVGFSSQSHLTANFRRTMGLTPRPRRRGLLQPLEPLLMVGHLDCRPLGLNDTAECLRLGRS